MAKYLFEGSYTAEGAKGLAKDGGTGRRAVVEEMINKLDGNIEAFYYAFGDPDVLVIVDVPDPVSAAAVSLAVNQTGAVQLKTRVLMTPGEIDQAAERSVSYRPPGK